jgi:hypothetical protein
LRTDVRCVRFDPGLLYRPGARSVGHNQNKGTAP